MVSVSHSAVYTFRPCGLPCDSSTSTPAIPIPFSSHCLRIHAWLVFGWPMTGAYQTQGIGEDAASPFGRIRKAAEPCTSKKSRVQGSCSASAFTDGIGRDREAGSAARARSSPALGATAVPPDASVAKKDIGANRRIAVQRALRLTSRIGLPPRLRVTHATKNTYRAAKLQALRRAGTRTSSRWPSSSTLPGHPGSGRLPLGT